MKSDMNDECCSVRDQMIKKKAYREVSSVRLFPRK